MDSRIKSSVSRTDANKRRGFSLPEVMVALVVVSLLLTGMFTTFMSFNQGMHVSMNHADQSAKVEFAFEKIRQQMHAISNVHSASAASFEFTTKSLDGATERLRIYFDSDTGTLFEEDLDGNTRALLSSVSDAQFTFYDRFGDETSTLIDINAGKLILDTQRATTSGSKDVRTETAVITFRNRTL